MAKFTLQSLQVTINMGSEYFIDINYKIKQKLFTEMKGCFSKLFKTLVLDYLSSVFLKTFMNLYMLLFTNA